MKAKELPTKVELEKRYSYDPETGILTGKLRGGRPIGYRTGKGKYLMVNINRKNYQAHRIIWRLMTGDDPGELVIDHINRNTFDNRWENLRAITVGDNRFNNGQSCIFKTSCGTFRVTITFRNETIINKRFKTEAEALEVARAVKEKCASLI